MPHGCASGQQGLSLCAQVAGESATRAVGWVSTTLTVVVCGRRPELQSDVLCQDWDASHDAESALDCVRRVVDQEIHNSHQHRRV